MGKFDPIDIFFIAIISAYFITLFCILVTLVYIKLVNLFKNKKKNNKSEQPIIEREVKIKSKKTRYRMADIALFRKLFMNEIKPKTTIQNKVVLTETKIELKENNTDFKEMEVKKNITNNITSSTSIIKTNSDNNKSISSQNKNSSNKTSSKASANKKNSSSTNKKSSNNKNNSSKKRKKHRKKTSASKNKGNKKKNRKK